MTVEDATRKAFEAWTQSPDAPLMRLGGYYDEQTNNAAWLAWQESRKQALEEAAKACHQHAQERDKSYGETGLVKYKDKATGALHCFLAIKGL
jgi:hypothetical protein